ncbi:MAG TPA: 4-(cytidine 5'-diphospho)-2-C-methyl-D-erythritol kinase [Fusobacteriaceae bacterium]|nr:4-(cytidine 5'-diphospho)-2-C-methyl-D-erythritol kinase [Fusobacteriaceae bacterium]
MIVKLKSNAKINLGLNIVGKAKNGYHLLDMVMVPISLSDELEINFKEIKGKLKIETNIKEIPTGKENIIFKIYNEFYKETKFEKQMIEVYLKKYIPSQAGLGGGSSNGAFFFNALNKYYGNPITLQRAVEITKKIGSDIPFFLLNKSTRIKGIGENLEVIENNIKNKIILIKPDFGISTIMAYRNYSKLKNKKNANVDKIIERVKSGYINDIENYLENHLEQGLLLENKNIIKFKKYLEKIERDQKIKFNMSGSGSCYYAFIKTNNIDVVYNKIKTTMEGCRVEICSLL